MFNFFPAICENYNDRFPMVNPQTNFLFHKNLLIHVWMNRLS